MTDIAIYGAGGLGREVAAVMRNINNSAPTWNLVGFFDDGKPKGETIGAFGPVLGGIDCVNAWDRELAVVLCMGTPRTMQTVYSKITNPLISFPNIIDMWAYLSNRPTIKMGIGNIILGDSVMTTDVTLGNFNLLNGSVTLGHDVHTGDFNVFMPGCRISGGVTIGDRNMFGSMSFVKQYLDIGNDVILSPLSPLLTKPKDGGTYMGNPARRFKF